MDKVPEDVLARLDALAEKLGATGEYLWQAMVEYQFARGCVGVAIGAWIAGVGIVLAICGRNHWRRIYKEDRFGDYELWAALSVVGVIAVGCGTVVLLFNTLSIFVPEGAALRALIGR